MSESAADRGKGYSIEARNKYFLANLAIAEHEIRPGLTVSFLSEVDLTEVERVRAKTLPTQSKPSYTAFVVKALALAIRDFPYANRRVTLRGLWPFGGPRLQAFTRIDIAVAVERDIPGSPSTMFIDIIRDADAAPLDRITSSLHDLATCDVTTNKQWREFSGLITRLPTWLSTLLIRLPVYSPSHWVQYRGGPALVSSPAKYGVDAVVGTWVHPIGVSFGLVKPRPVAVGMRVEVRPTFMLTLNFDRRVMAGAQAARFFNRMVEALEHAEAQMTPFLFPEAPPTREDLTALNITVLEK
jgi:pyruvate/2-oxoglutarate dehydrogenase complex dihydrolipoamide acyltransferase (E2) component